MITLAIIIALSFVLLFGASVRRRIKRDRDGGLLDVSCNHCGKWIDASGGAHICRFRVAFKLNALAIGIGGSLAAPPLPHHLAYGSVPRRFEKLR